MSCSSRAIAVRSRGTAACTSASCSRRSGLRPLLPGLPGVASGDDDGDDQRGRPSADDLHQRRGDRRADVGRAAADLVEELRGRQQQRGGDRQRDPQAAQRAGDDGEEHPGQLGDGGQAESPARDRPDQHQRHGGQPG